MPRLRRIATVTVLTGWVLATPPAVQGQGPLAPNQVPPEVVQAMLEGPRPLAFVPGEVLVKRRVVAGAAMDLPKAQLDKMQIDPGYRELSGGVHLYRMAADTVRALARDDAEARTLAMVEELRGQPEIEFAQPNYIARIAASPRDPLFERQWHYFDNGDEEGRSPGGISLQSAWDRTTGSPSVVVAVIDTGILPEHEDITGSPALVPGYDMISSAQTANDGDGRDDDPTDTGDGVSAGECGPGGGDEPSSWHGTHVAGTVGVVRTGNEIGVAGVNWSSGVQAVRVLGKCGGTIADINDAIRWAAGLPVPGVPQNATPAKVINLSLGASAPCSDSPATQAAIDDAVAAGTTVVVAAGNSAMDASGSFPASCDGVVTVAASDARGHLVTRYSNYGETVDILAPGGDVQRDDDDDGNPDGVYSTVLGGYAYYNGTSMAAPHVAGVAALLLAEEGSLTPSQVLERLQQAALPRTAVQCPRPCGAGLLSASPVTTLAVSPGDIDLQAGDSSGLQVQLLEGGEPVEGRSVTFTSQDPAVASVDPPGGTTDGEGRTGTTVTGRSNGDTAIETRAGDVRRATPVRVPVFNAVLVLLLTAGLYGAARRLTRGGGRR